MRQKFVGFTLLELLVTLTIVAILAAIAAPSFSNLIANSRMNSAETRMVNAIQMARSEASARNQEVFVNAADGWGGRIIVAADTNADGEFDADDAIVKIFNPAEAGVTIATEPADRTQLSYLGTGRLNNPATSASEFVMCSEESAQGRRITLNAVGRLGVANEDCSGS
ncbi:GspH/FimT family protein [Marinibactrum halimedae]|uniref:Type II secretion system protein H n=1 Tax=Marinibactrum halimedae TaxID=1444977 RepID=A0AA37TDX6_9GAMM|nr:GspH/FimT family protein [Marinibactrum halimedae]MCD9459511.1 GspH/FimT family protein [Marinibactrum halimedae]GLS28165.1 hypothetical protein GCM10007877_38840 [Marinibactrum halimedae]